MAIIPCNQLSLADVFTDCQDIYESDKPEFLSLLQSNIDLDENIARKFCSGQLFKAIINKKEIIAYFLNDSNENEIVVYLDKNYTKIH